MSGAKSKTPSDELYMQLFEMHGQLEYLGEHRLALKVLERLDEIWETFDAGEKKDMAIAVLNITGMTGG